MDWAVHPPRRLAKHPSPLKVKEIVLEEVESEARFDGKWVLLSKLARGLELLIDRAREKGACLASPL